MEESQRAWARHAACMTKKNQRNMGATQGGKGNGRGEKRREMNAPAHDGLAVLLLLGHGWVLWKMAQSGRVG